MVGLQQKDEVTATPRPFIAKLFSFSSLLFALFLTAAYIFCSHRAILRDPDIGWHLRNAQTLLQSHSFLRQDSYSFTIQGRPWINPEWLAELPYFFAWRWFGYRGLFFMTVGLIELLVAGCCFLGWQRTRNVRPAMLAGSIFLVLATVSMGPRTLMFGWLCLILELAVLTAFSAGNDQLWTLPPLFALWINLHGSWPVGILFLAIYIVTRWRDISWGAIYADGVNRHQRRKLVWICGLSFLALFANPYGWHLVAYPFIITLHHPLTINTVQEWQSLDFHSLLGRLFFAIVGGVIIASMARRRRWELHELLFLLVSVLAASTYSRFLPLAGIVLTPFLAREFQFFGADDISLDRPILNAAIICILGGFVAFQIPTAAALKEQSEEGYPVKAAEFLRSHQGAGPLLNDFNWGGYLEWRVPEVPVFIDTRADVFEQWGVLSDYLNAVKLAGLADVLSKYNIDRVLFSKDEPVVLLLRNSPSWKVEYEDDTAVLLRRR